MQWPVLLHLTEEHPELLRNYKMNKENVRNLPVAKLILIRILKDIASIILFKALMLVFNSFIEYFGCEGSCNMAKEENN
jgi:hypothetical protein